MLCATMIEPTTWYIYTTLAHYISFSKGEKNMYLIGLYKFEFGILLLLLIDWFWFGWLVGFFCD